MINFYRIVVSLIMFVYAAAASAKVYYVSPSGNDSNPGTISQPWKTWGKAFNSTSVQPGDTVYFRDGVYYKEIDAEPAGNFLGYGYKLTRDGISGNYIHYYAYPGETPILDCGLLQTSGLTASDNNYGIRSLDINYIKFKGLTVRNVWQGQGASGYENSSTGWGFYGSHIEFDNCTVYNVHGRGFHVDATNQDSIYFTNCDAYYCTDSLTYSAPGNDGTGFGVGVNNTESDTSDYVVFTGCRAWYCGDQGFSAAPKGKVEINSCWSFHNGILEGAGWGFKYGWTLNTLTDGMINTSIHNSIAAYNKSSGFNTNDPGALPLHTNIYNNTSYYNGYVGGSDPNYPGYGFYLFNTDGTNTQEYLRDYKNNISYNNSDGDIKLQSNALYTHDHNSWDIPILIADKDFISIDSAGISGPRKADGSLPDLNGFMELSSNSILIDAGINVGFPFFGTKPDLGCLEYVGEAGISPVPEYLGSTVENATPSRLEITYSLTLANIVPAASAFTVWVNSSARNVTSVTISGTKVMLSLASPVAFGDIVTVAYTKPASNPLQTPSGGQATSFMAQPVTNNCSAALNQPPIINISSPTKSTSYIAPATITIEANASDPDGTINKVEFYQGTIKIGEVNSTPYSFTWKEVSEGTYSITAAATDDQNLRTLSSAVSIVVEKSAYTINQIPTVNITSPKKNKNYKKNDKIVIEAFASDPDGSVSKVEFKNGNITLAEVTTAPYTYTWEPVDTGTYIISAIATDNLGAISTSSDMELIIGLVYDTNSEIIDLYPNPNDGHFTINMYIECPEQDTRISIINLSGKVIYNDIIKDQEYFREFDLSGIPAGTYILMVTIRNTILTTSKFIKI